MRRFVMLALGLGLALPGHALTPDFGAEAQLTYQDAEDATTARIVSGAWQSGVVPERLVEGRVETFAWKIATEATTHALMTRLAAQLQAEGWTTLFACETRACGGFDFRYSLPIVHEPDMHVDLGDFRYLAAERGEAVLSLLVSRARQNAFAQMTLVTPGAIAVTPAPTPQAPLEVEQPAPPAESGDLGPQLLQQGSVVLDDLVFASGKAQLAPGDYPSLRALANFLQQNAEAEIALVGHTDATGSLQGNIALSRDRARAVRQALIDIGAPAGRIAAEGVGHLAPLVSNLTPEGRAKNRRVEAMLTSTRIDATP
jgi:OOP family OmpA-OmpF porin